MFRKLSSQLSIIALVLLSHLLGLGVMFSQAQTTPPKPEAALLLAALLPPTPKAEPVAQQQPKPLPRQNMATVKKPPPANTIAKPAITAPPSERAIAAPEAEPAVNATTEPSNISTKPAAQTIAPPVADASAAQNRAPVYPLLSRKKKEQGTVLLKLLVKADGTVGSISVQHSSGYPRLDQAALNAVKSWRFVPATQQGQALDYWYEMPMTFALNN